MANALRHILFSFCMVKYLCSSDILYMHNKKSTEKKEYGWSMHSNCQIVTLPEVNVEIMWTFHIYWIFCIFHIEYGWKIALISWCAFFLTNMIIKEKKHPSEKRVLFVAIASQGYCFGTLFFWVEILSTLSHHPNNKHRALPSVSLLLTS